MSLSRIKGQDAAVARLSKAFESGRMSHAYLFHGPEGVGKETTALEFAAALNCESGGLDPCGTCRSCRMAAGLSHPDIHLIFPAPRTAKPAELSAIRAAYVTNGYRDADFGRKTAIVSVETILSDLVAKANQRPYIGPWKAFVVADADAMTTEAANTLLKTLEEPPEMTVIVLTTSRPSALPSTVLSRCQKIAFARLSRSTIEEILRSDPRFGVDAKAAKAASAMSEGSVGRAVRSDGQGLADELKRVAALMSGRRDGDVRGLLDEAARLSYRLGRHEQQRVLDLMLLWLRDVLRVSQSGDREPELLFTGQRRTLEAQAGAYSVTDITRLVDRIDGARRAIERYSNASIVFTSVLLDLAIVRKEAATRSEAEYAV